MAAVNDTSSLPDDERKASSSASSSPDKDGLDRVELSDLDSTPPQAPIEQDLMQLARLGEIRAIQRLFDSGRYSARSTDDQGITPLHWAAINGHLALCHFLITSGADVNAKGGDAQATPVLWASKRFNLPVISLLLEHGADPLERDDQGYNLLHSATLDGNVFQLVMLLHQPDLPVDVPDAQGHTALMWAAYKGFPACIDILLRFGADVHAADDMGFTALHWALVKGNYACIQKLVEYGSDRTVRSKPAAGQTEGDSPSMTASKMKSERQWHKALADCGYDQSGHPIAFPIPAIKDRKRFFSRIFFFWPFVLGGLQLHMLAFMPMWISLPGVFIVGYGLQILAGKLLKWAPSDMKSMQKTPVLAGVFAGTLFWVGVRYVLKILPATLSSHFLLNIAFATSYGLCTYFYFMTMTADPGFIPKGNSRGQTKKTIDELVEHNAFNETHFCTTCMIRKPLRSKHCRRCNRCVAREDHHCPWVDNCVALNNHKHFILYVIFMIAGLGLLVQLTISYLEIIPAPPNPQCTVLKDELCGLFMKDPLTIVTNAWGELQLTWTFMLIFVHLFQVATNTTTYESMRHANHVGPIAAAMATGSTSLAAAGITDSGAGPDPAAHSHSHHGHSHGPRADSRKPPSFLGFWSKTLGIDTFLTIAFRGYRSTQNASGNAATSSSSSAAAAAARKENPFSRGLFRNCQDFWLDGPIFGRGEGGKGLLGGEKVDYAHLYEVPRGGGGGYEMVPGGDGGEV